jgi:hypothetical protein
MLSPLQVFGRFPRQVRGRVFVTAESWIVGYIKFIPVAIPIAATGFAV